MGISSRWEGCGRNYEHISGYVGVLADLFWRMTCLRSYFTGTKPITIHLDQICLKSMLNERLDVGSCEGKLVPEGPHFCINTMNLNFWCGTASISTVFVGTVSQTTQAKECGCVLVLNSFGYIDPIFPWWRTRCMIWTLNWQVFF